MSDEREHRGDEHHLRRLDRLRNAARRARLLARPRDPDAAPPELENPRPELDIFARHLKRRARPEEPGGDP